MRTFFGILLVAVAFGFSGCSAKLDKLEYTLPVKVGKSWPESKEAMGTPDRSGNNFYTYFDKGVLVYVDAKQELVTALICSWFQGGKHFSGKVYGIGLGDTYPRCVQLWGEPVEKKNSSYDYYQAKWLFKKLFIEVEFWAHDGDDADLGGKFQTDTAKRIKISL
jgi:hypothetical protein